MANRSKKGKLPVGPSKGPPKRSQPLPGNKQQQSQDVIKRLQDLVKKKDKIIQGLNAQIKTLNTKNSALEKKLTQAKKSSPSKPPPKKKGVDSGPSQGAAAANLAGLLGGHVKNKKKAEDKANGVSGGLSQKDAAAALGGIFAKKKAPPKKTGGGVSGGMSQQGAAAALGGLFAKKKAPPKASSGGGGGAKKSGGGGGGGAGQYKSLFKKYEMMMKLGINVHGAVGRMRQDGCDKAAIKAFEKKHGALDDFEEKEDAAKYGLKEKKEVAVSRGIKMKRLHWDTIAIKYVKGSIWEKLDESSIRYDRKHFELHFQVRQRKPLEEKKDGSKPQAEAGKIITFVSKKRTQAVLIGLRNLNLENEQLRDVLHNMDETVMNVDTLSKLLEMAPSMDEQTEAEKKIMQEGTRRAKDYGTVEQFFFALCDFYNLHQRLKLWMFKQNFYEICDSLLDQYKTIGKACDKIGNNKNLRLLLTVVLTFGNHMNSGTRKGQQYGFDLKVLTGMTGVKSFDNTRSLLMYIYEFCDRKYPNAIKVLPELTDTLKSASSMEVETLKQAYKRIRDNMADIKNLITSDEIENYDIDDRFIMELTKFHKGATPKMKKFNMTVGNVMVSTKRVMKKFTYGSEEAPQTIESFFKIWWKFVQDFAGAKEKLIQLEKERQKRIAKRKKAKNKEMQKKMFKKYGQKDKQLPNDGQELQKGGTLHREFQKRQQFEQKKGALHGKLRGHVKQRSFFIANGGKVDKHQPQTDTMRRLSSMYQDQQSQVKALEEARKKAAILKYNKFQLPSINKANKNKWGATSFGGNFQVPDDKPMMAPGMRGGGGGPKAPTMNNKPPAKMANGNRPQQKKKTASNGFKIGKKPLKIAPKQKQKPKQGHVPPPPSGGPPNRAQGMYGAAPGPSGGGAYPSYGQNPGANWQQQAMGYGSNPNLSYQQAQQFQQPNNQAYHQQQRQQYGQQPKTYYNNPYKQNR
eukprot:554821_1